METKGAVIGFVEFVRERGIVGLAIGFILGSAVQKVVTSFVADIVNPFIDLLTGQVGGFVKFSVGPFAIGDFISALIDFLILATIVYFLFRGLGLHRLDKPKEK